MLWMVMNEAVETHPVDSASKISAASVRDKPLPPISSRI